MTIVRFEGHANVEVVAQALHHDGVVIVERLIHPDVMEGLVETLEADLQAEEIGGGSFFGHRRRGVSGLFGRGPEFSDLLLTNPTVLGVADAVLLPACAAYQVHASGVMQVWGGGTNQPLHREMDIYAPYLTQAPDDEQLVVFYMFAGSDFTLDNGATRLVPGSHRWPLDRKPTDDEIAQAVMPTGSVVIWLGRTLHGLGASTSEEPRTGVGFSLSAAWLRQEENQYLAVPPDTAATLPRRVQQLLGYRVHGPLVGWVGGRNHDCLLESAV